jgi:CheY-like chemotaxis protein
VLTLRGKRILLVEDEIDALELIQMVLVGAGAKVEMASNAEAALVHMKNGPFDIVVSDIGLPEMDGYELAPHLRALAKAHGSEPPMVAFTAFTDAAHRQRAVDAGFVGHIAKPVDPVALVALVARLLALADAPGARPTSSGSGSGSS